MLFVGRTRELDEISARLTEAADGRGSLVLLVGAQDA
jgi:predicted ATPase